MSRSNSSLLVSQESYQGIVQLDIEHNFNTKIYTAKWQDRIPVYLNTKACVKIPYEIYNMFMASSCNKIILNDEYLFIELLIMYFISYYPKNTDDFGYSIKNQENLMFTLCTSNKMSEEPCMYSNSIKTTDIIKDLLKDISHIPLKKSYDLLYKIILDYERERSTSS